MTIRPSLLPRIVACPGALQASAGAPDWSDEYEDTAAREEGTAAHWVAHSIDVGVRPQVGSFAENGVKVDQDMLDHADAYLAELAKWPVPAVLETTLPMPHLPRGTVGTPDAGAYDPRTNTIYNADYKYGFRIVDPQDNPQLLSYGLALAAKYVPPGRMLDLKFSFSIAQPRRWHRGGAYRTWYVSYLDVLPLIDSIQTAVDDALKTMPPLNPGPHCRYCPGRASCGALRETVGAPLYVDTHALSFEDAERELIYLMRHSEMLESYIEGLRIQVTHGLKVQGKSSNLFEMRRYPGRLEWNPDKVQELRRVVKLTGQNIDKPADLITPTQARKVLGDALVNMYSRRGPEKVDFSRSDVEIWKRIFGK